jgi:hypothetical protein
MPQMGVTRIGFLFAAVLAMAPACTHAADAISFKASDRVQVFADYFSAGSKAKPLILLFHQAGFKSHTPLHAEGLPQCKLTIQLFAARQLYRPPPPP